MYNYMLPQANVNANQEKIENYVFDLMDSNYNLFKHFIDNFDKVSGHTFTTYSSKVKNITEYNIENAKEVIRTGKFKCSSCTPNKV